MFGGIHESTYYGNLCIFNVENEYWRSQSVTGDTSNSRHSHAVDSDSDAFIIFGGEDASGLDDGLFIYNSLDYNWKKFTPKTNKPKATKGACVVLKFPIVFIYGGITPTGLSNEFWKFDIVTLEFTQLRNNDYKVAYVICHIRNNIFYATHGTIGHSKPFNG